jgi:hypothetical protein
MKAIAACVELDDRMRLCPFCYLVLFVYKTWMLSSDQKSIDMIKRRLLPMQIQLAAVI